MNGRLRKYICLSLMVGVFPVAGVAAPVQNIGFAEPQECVVEALKTQPGKPVTTGWVFIDGKFLFPPYRVERYGNVIRINNIQVTGPIVSWDAFLVVQDGCKIEKTASVDNEGEAVAAGPEAEEKQETSNLDSVLDDLFADDDDEPAAKTSKKSAAKKEKKPPRPAVSYSIKFDGEFVMNEKAEKLLDKIENYRARTESLLATGGYCCFGSRHSALSGDAGAAKFLMERLPEAMRDSASLAQFSAKIKASGIKFFSSVMIQEFFQHRTDFPRLLQRRRRLEERDKWNEF